MQNSKDTERALFETAAEALGIPTNSVLAFKMFQAGRAALAPAVAPSDEIPISRSTFGSKEACEQEHARRTSAAPVQPATQEMMRAFDAHFAATAPALAQPVQDDHELIEAARAVVARWDSPKWKDELPTAGFINRLRAALATNTASPAEQGDALVARISPEITASVRDKLQAAGFKRTGAQQAGELTDADIVKILNKRGIDTTPSKYGFAELQVSATCVPIFRSVVMDCIAHLATPADPTVPGATAAGRDDAKPYAYEYGKSNGDGTYSVVIERGDMVKVGEAKYDFGPPKNAHKDWPVKQLFEGSTPASGQEGATADASDARDAARWRFIEEHASAAGGGKGFEIRCWVPVDCEDMGCGVDAAIKAMAGAAS